MDGAFRRAVADARRQGGLHFAALLSEDRITAAFDQARSAWQGWVYTPAVTVWTFLAQCMNPDHSCRDAVARLIAWRVACGMDACSAETGAYCTARDDLPEEACAQLVRDTGRQAAEEAPAEWLWHGHRVKTVDGATVTMADTPQNQAEYPQLRGQAVGCGFPIARVVVLFSLAVGVVLDAAIGKYQGKKTGENSMFRSLHDSLQADDVLLADRYFSGWFDIALLRQRGVHVVVRKHQKRSTDFRTGTRLGDEDHLVVWRKPRCPAWMTPEQHAELPHDMTLREVRVRVSQKGFRTKMLVVVTTLLDAKIYSADEIAALYRRRWQAELNLRSLKTVLQMDHLRCKKPHRVRNEFFVHLLAYNLIRQLMAQAAAENGREPWTVSFKGTLQTTQAMLPMLIASRNLDEWCQVLLTAIATHVVGDRPDRYEPRMKKRRPNKYKLLKMPRRQYKRIAA